MLWFALNAFCLFVVHNYFQTKQELDIPELPKDPVEVTPEDHQKCLKTLYPKHSTKTVNPKKKYVCAVCKSVCDLFGLFLHMKQVSIAINCWNICRKNVKSRVCNSIQCYDIMKLDPSPFYVFKYMNLFFSCNDSWLEKNRREILRYINNIFFLISSTKAFCVSIASSFSRKFLIWINIYEAFIKFDLVISIPQRSLHQLLDPLSLFSAQFATKMSESKTWNVIPVVIFWKGQIGESLTVLFVTESLDFKIS